MHRLALPFTLVLLVILAGCATAPTETTTTPAGDETFEVEMTGNSSATYVVTARLVADPFENVTVTYANGSAQAVAVLERQGAITFGPESNVTAVEPREEVVGGVYFEGSPNFSVTDHSVPQTRNVVYTVRQEGEEVLVAWGLVRCDGHVTKLSLRADEPGVTGVGFACES